MRYMYILAVTITALLSYNLSFGQELSGEGVVFPAMAVYPTSPVQGQVIYYTATDPDEYQYFDGTDWLPLSPTSGGVGATDMIMDLVNGDGKVKVLNGGTNNDAITFDLNGLQKMNLHHNSGNPKLLLNGDLQLFDNTGAIEFWDNGTIESELDFNGSTLSLKNNDNGDLNLETTGDDIFLQTGDDILFRQGGITKAVMNQDGDFGLGTTNPAAKLQLNHSTSEADPNLYINGVGGSAARIKMSSNSTSEYWQQIGNSLTDPKLQFTYRDNGVTNQILTLDGDSKMVGINDATPSAALQIDGPAGEDVLRARLAGDTRFMVHDNGSISVGSSASAHEADLARFAVPIRLVPQSSETCSNSSDVGKIYFDSDADKLRVCVADNNGILPGGDFEWVNLH